jgi:thiamine biosynthesis lipoprotein
MKKSRILLTISAVVLVAVIFITSLLQSNTKDASLSNFAMGSPVTIKVYGEKNGNNLCSSAFDRISYIDRTYLSHNMEISAVSTLNKNQLVVADEWFSDYLEECVELSEKSSCFTLFSGEMKSLWKIEDGGYVPTDDEVARTLENLNKASVKIDDNSISINNSFLDLGALGKGTACDEAIEYLKGQEVENALVTVGGSIGAIGKDSYKIGIRNPFGTQNEYFAVLSVTDCFISTSGDYEKYFEKDGVRYSHIFDAKSGKPVQNDISSVTVIADNGTLSDFLSTAIFCEGIENGKKLADEFGAEVIIVKKDKSVLISKGLEEKLTINDDNFIVSVIE